MYGEFTFSPRYGWWLSGALINGGCSWRKSFFDWRYERRPLPIGSLLYLTFEPSTLSWTACRYIDDICPSLSSTSLTRCAPSHLVTLSLHSSRYDGTRTPQLSRLTDSTARLVLSLASPALE